MPLIRFLLHCRGESHICKLQSASTCFVFPGVSNLAGDLDVETVYVYLFEGTTFLHFSPDLRVVVLRLDMTAPLFDCIIEHDDPTFHSVVIVILQRERFS